METADGDDDALEPDATLEDQPSVLFDAVVVPDGDRAAEELGDLGQALEFIKDQYRHCKAILMLGTAQRVVEGAGVLVGRGEDWALVRDLPSFIKAVARHRNWDRAEDPPRV